MTPKEKRETLTFLYNVAVCARRAADASCKHHEYAELRKVIAANEREHRRLVGDIGRRMRVEQACDYFVAKVLARGATEYRYGKAPIARLEGTRLDFIIGALLMSNEGFRAAFFKNVEAICRPHELFKRIEAADYAALVSKVDGK